ncbi:tRNA synthetases class II core domain (F)-domain-containing protein [Penicillium cosmopolitanum]|uniref:Phenylalanine--tRNA ligase alpha subunit n=1 Tax=Penicillium cosmopolitanum TaxID=1131564 RepID=A0A9W9VP47_9EURO|nr:tRNA synthetases class II core domain (F)-domain-containing protein [Penicillium cosmopolitanum]XP_057124902.1 tRNA synthetases class II core domain (F)-domain-containing protein [Penicillium waksmanii]KAJ5386700.1 tRNA synthetases class II core domain (F)-domain-containing protein [Penicillium cosmopolitanum]KAJ5988812.1 tRNA synthetases class II core domain (F)-domain-containing protein [Penicillium waksmanii]
MASDLTAPILDALSASDTPILSSEAFPSDPSLKVKSALDRLATRQMVEYETIDKEIIELTPEGEEIATNGSHEAKVFDAVVKALDGLKIADLPAIVGKDNAKVGQGNAFKQGWIKKDKDLLRATRESIVDLTRETLLTVQRTNTLEDTKAIADLKRRKLITLSKAITFKITKGPKYAREFVKEETDLTFDMLSNGAWKDIEFKAYNFSAKGALTPSGALHPLSKVRAEFRNIFFEMGFEEMPTNRFVETGFWNFDALFVPQQHPARDLQDTFYIADPLTADGPREDPANDPHCPKNTQDKPLDYKKYWDNVHDVHEKGKFGSIGYRYPWSADESLRLVLRTHTTSISAYMLHKLAANPRPARFFSIDRVFRNEAVDATHLAEFHQIEGVIADFGLTLGGLIGFMEVFFAKMNIHQLRFKPAYNPYTEPSMEIFGYHEGLGKWVEIGNSGMFRPEMLESMGIPKGMQVYGWGLSLERPTMIKYGVSNIRELLGHKVDLNFIESNPAVRLEK